MAIDNLIVSGKVETNYEVPRALAALSARVDVPQLELAGRLMVSGLDILVPLDWNSIGQLDTAAHRVFGDNPDGPAGSLRAFTSWTAPVESWKEYLLWCNNNPVNIPGIVKSTFRSSLALSLEEQGTEFVESLAIQNYTHYMSRLNTDFFWSQHGGLGGCLDREPASSFGGCLDRSPLW